METIKLDYEMAANCLGDFEELPHRARELLVSYMFYEMENRKEITIIDFITVYFCFNSRYYKSPIEIIYALAIYIVLNDLPCPECELFAPDIQVKITTNNKNYIVDFVFDTSDIKGIYRDNDYKLIVECDGHEFHKKTKEQIAHDNQRDLDLKSAGYDILHFSGSQIYRDPYKCAKDTIDYLISKIGSFYFVGVGNEKH